MSVEIIMIYNDKERFVRFNYYGKVLDSPIELHAPRWSIKNVELDNNVIKKLKKSDSFTLNNFRRKNGKYGFEVIGKRNKSIEDIILEMELIHKPLANILRDTLPYRVEVRTSGSFVDTKRRYVDFHLYPYEWLQWELTLRLREFSKNENLLKILTDPLTLMIFAYILKDDSIFIKQFDRSYKAKYQKVRRRLQKLTKMAILRRIGRSPSIYKFSTEEIKMDILNLLLVINRLLYHVR